MPAPYGDGLYAIEPPPGNGLNITELFHIVQKKDDDPDINSAVDSKYPNVAIITFDRTNQFGGMWAKEKLDLTMPFSTEIYLHLGRQYGSNTNIADGMTFTLHNDPAELDAIGGAGEGLGVYKGRKWRGVGVLTTPHGTFLRNSLVVEFDTNRNMFPDAFVDDPPGTAHCSVIIPRKDSVDQNDHNNTKTFSPIQDWVRFAADWTPNATGGGTLSYEFDGIKESFVVLNVESTFGGTKVYWGFTGATGQRTAVQAAAITRLPKQGVTAAKTVKNADGADINHGGVLSGDIITYTIRTTALPLTNPISPVVIEDEISLDTTFVSAEVLVNTNTGGPYISQHTYDSNLLRVNTGRPLNKEDDWIEIEYSVRVNAGAVGKQIYNFATVSAEGLPDSEKSNTTDVTVFAEARKWVSDTSAAGKNSSPVSAGDQITYEIEYANEGVNPTTVVITDVLDIGLDFVEASKDGSYDPDTRIVTWTLDNVSVGTGTVLLIVKVNKSAMIRIENRATVTVNGSSQDTAPTVNPVTPEKPVKKIADNSETGKSGAAVKAGDRIIYEISYLNYTDDEAEIVITDKLPTGMDFLSSNPDGTYNSANRTITWTLPTVPSAGRGSVTVQIRVNKTAMWQIVNYATVQVGDLVPQNTNLVKNPIKGSHCPDKKQVTKCRTTITGRKIWLDNNNDSGARPSAFEITLLRDGESYKSITIDSADDGAYAFTCLPIWKNPRQKYVYQVDELVVPDNYTKTIDGYNVINTLN